MAARLFQAVGVMLVVVGLLAGVFDIPVGLPRTMLTLILVGGILCLVVYLVLDRMEGRKVP